MIRRALAGLAFVLAGAAAPMPEARLLSFDDLSGWAEDDHAAALDVFLSTCGDMRGRDWATLCAFARTGPEPRAFFERFFLPVEWQGEALFTGYYEPELRGDRWPSDYYHVPLYAPPPELPTSGPWLTRRQIEETGVMEDRGLALAWVADPVDAVFLQIQGSGRIRLPGGEMMRLGYAAANRREYSSLGEMLIERGIFEPHEVSAERIRAWVRANPEEGAELIRRNDSYVFFRRVDDVPADQGPLGAMNRSVTPMRSLAVDPAYVPLGAPVWMEKAGAEPMARLMVAQDTGSAIKGPQRADIFFGTGREAGRAAGTIRDGGRLVMLLPIQLAHAVAADPGTEIR
ncbi:murein transglycosylase A [Pseudoroseicyclus tamaricis]|uniref:peptidoglycan lytic exotransglycosylase n=1 Tax=Pseudoroseicyclus tamaricis TaxID=2705421 RepID=A0A6B2K753_9RHOB|nr:MltA domain-containing protein [Pseudoroseicyclus tamaricis]NDV02786.1 murein transglycosylase [Pseudoroseicyclus tamaricis]